MALKRARPSSHFKDSSVSALAIGDGDGERALATTSTEIVRREPNFLLNWHTRREPDGAAVFAGSADPAWEFGEHVSSEARRGFQIKEAPLSYADATSSDEKATRFNARRSRDRPVSDHDLGDRMAGSGVRRRARNHRSSRCNFHPVTGPELPGNVCGRDFPDSLEDAAAAHFPFHGVARMARQLLAPSAIMRVEDRSIIVPREALGAARPPLSRLRTPSNRNAVSTCADHLWTAINRQRRYRQ